MHDVRNKLNKSKPILTLNQKVQINSLKNLSKLQNKLSK